MATTQSHGFLILPTELRLEVYKHVIVDCLDKGSVSDVAGLFLCCREVHRELEAEFMAKIRPLLKAKYEWEASGFEHGILRMKVRPSLNAKVGRMGLSVTMPSKINRTNGYEHRKPKEHLQAAATSLRPVFASQWSVLTLNLKGDHHFGCLSFNVDSMIMVFLRRLNWWRIRNDGQLRLPDRLVLNYGSFHASMCPEIFLDL